MATTYIKSLKVADLRDLASETDLPGYSDLKKAELADALDDHLRKNSTSLATKPTQSDGMREYYGKLRPQSPAKKVADRVARILSTDDEDKDNQLTVAKKARRKTVAPGEETTRATSSSTDLITAAKTPAKEISRRASILAANISPPSPAVVTEAIDQQYRKISTFVADTYDKTHLTEYLDTAREKVSSQYVINALFLILEARGLQDQILPSKKFFDVSPIPYVKDTKTSVDVPDIFLILESSFWAIFSCWLATSLVIPAIAAYFINLPLKAQSSHSYSTRRATTHKNKELTLDPLIFNITKALASYLVYSCHFGLIYSNFTTATVNTAVFGGWQGMVTTASIGGVLALYEAILKK